MYLMELVEVCKANPDTMGIKEIFENKAVFKVDKVSLNIEVIFGHAFSLK